MFFRYFQKQIRWYLLNLPPTFSKSKWWIFNTIWESQTLMVFENITLSAWTLTYMILSPKYLILLDMSKLHQYRQKHYFGSRFSFMWLQKLWFIKRSVRFPRSLEFMIQTNWIQFLTVFHQHRARACSKDVCRNTIWTFLQTSLLHVSLVYLNQKLWNENEKTFSPL